MEILNNKLRSIDEIPSKYRSIFSKYPCFNVMQSAILDDSLWTDKSLVISAPTGSGKTSIFEIAIIRHLMLIEEHEAEDLSLGLVHNNKIVYISPIKALCQERLIDWHKKFAQFGLNSVSVTSDNDEIDCRTVMQYDLIISTPEKWDVLTRKWRQNDSLVASIGLFLIDEVHLLNIDSRGPTLEVIVSRMKTVASSLIVKKSIRFVALSATIPNIEDIAEWIGPSETTKYFKFSEDVRPVQLNKIVLGYNFNAQTQSIFKFDMSLSYKLSELISKYSKGKPTLIFCNTRKSVEMTAAHLISHLQIYLSPEQKAILQEISSKIGDNKLKQYVVHGIACHHAGMIRENREIIEESFRNGSVPVLVTTSTLAMGVNLPAHLVIVKCTKFYSDGGYKDYDEMSIFQMIGRAGRSQFGSSATALILTTLQEKAKYENMLLCAQTIESNLHKHLTEHLNAEVVLGTITDLEVAMRWLSSTFLYVRARKSPEKYKLSAELSKEKIDRKLLEMCQIDLNKLVKYGMIKMNEAIEVCPTVVGEIMAKYYVAFDTMKLFTQISGSEILMQILTVISKCKEFSDIYLRSNDKKTLNMLNRNDKYGSVVRFQLSGRIKTIDMKINVIIQAILGNLEINDQSILADSVRIIRNCERLTKCLIEYIETKENCFSALLNSIILCKCFQVKLWENSPFISKQLSGVGQVTSTLLTKAGKTTFKEIAQTNPRHIEMIVNRKAPFGSTLVEQARHMPEFNIHLKKLSQTVELTVTLLNPVILEENSTVDMASRMILLVGDSDNRILLYEKYDLSYILENPNVRRTIHLESFVLEFIKASFISEDWVGIDSSYTLELEHKESVTAIEEPKKNYYKQTFMDVYMNSVKKTTRKKKVISNKLINTNLKKKAKTKEVSLTKVVEEKNVSESISFENSFSNFNKTCDQLIAQEEEESSKLIFNVRREINASSVGNNKIDSNSFNDSQEMAVKADCLPNEKISEKSNEIENIQMENSEWLNDVFISSSNKIPKKDVSYSQSVFKDRSLVKSIKWRSPLVHSPTKKFSPIPRNRVFHFRRNFEQETPEKCNRSFSIIEESNGNLHKTMRDSIEVIPEKRKISSTTSNENLIKKRSKYELPLTDQDCTSDLEELCDMEDFGLKTGKKGMAANYYSQLLNSSASKEENAFKPEHLSEKDKENIPNLLENIETFSEDDLLANELSSEHHIQEEDDEKWFVKTNMKNIDLFCQTEPRQKDIINKTLPPHEDYMPPQSTYMPPHYSSQYFKVPEMPSDFHPSRQLIYDAPLDYYPGYPISVPPYPHICCTHHPNMKNYYVPTSPWMNSRYMPQNYIEHQVSYKAPSSVYEEPVRVRPHFFSQPTLNRPKEPVNERTPFKEIFSPKPKSYEIRRDVHYGSQTLNSAQSNFEEGLNHTLVLPSPGSYADMRYVDKTSNHMAGPFRNNIHSFNRFER
ncbi:hypothetical protein ABEB36_002100 [Hypothenemus hampei]|uniref:DNA 3'-5' helicase n=1 Tax=Hypothenemus hampei TaxID=57062 RepID=A0ABD1F4X2_HYPHA